MQPQVWDDARQVLDDMDFPATKEDLVAHASGRSGHANVIRLLRELPLGTYDNVEQVRQSIRINASAAEGQTPSEKADKVRSPHSHRIAEHLRDHSQTS
jgi:hypothetical protein